MLWKRTTAWGGLAGMLVGLVAAGVLDINKLAIFGYRDPYLHVGWWSFVASAVTVVLVSFATKPYSEERLRGLVFGTPRGPAENAD